MKTIRWMIAGALVLCVSSAFAQPRRRESLADRKVRKRLEDTRVSVSFDKVPVRDVLNSLQARGGVNIVPDRRLDGPWKKTVTLALRNVSLKDALRAVTVPMALDYAVRDGVVFVSEARTVAAGLKRRTPTFGTYVVTRRDCELFAKLADTNVSVTFDKTPTLEAVETLHTLGHVPIVPDRSKLIEPAQRTVSLKLKDVPLATAITLLAEQLDLTWCIRYSIVLISTEAECRPSPPIPEPAVYAANTPTAKDIRLKHTLDETEVSFTFNERPVDEAWQALAAMAKIPVVRDPEATFPKDRTVTLKLTAVPVGIAFRLLADQLDRQYIITGGKLFISTPERIGEMIEK